MDFLEKPLSQEEIAALAKKYGNYFKITADIDQGKVVVGCPLHADGEKILLKRGSRQDSIWGGGLDLFDKGIDCSAILNLRPADSNPSMEIIDSKKREKFIKTIKNIFKVLWEE
ncbi:hypothetical protein KBI33_01850 [Candidatus Shapirobacteria bacterium]|nr:hypothetical protein [Candidatus Shapirobacteria bacterium]